MLLHTNVREYNKLCIYYNNTKTLYIFLLLYTILYLPCIVHAQNSFAEIQGWLQYYEYYCSENTRKLHAPIFNRRVLDLVVLDALRLHSLSNQNIAINRRHSSFTFDLPVISSFTE